MILHNSEYKPDIALINPPYLEKFSRGQRSPAVIKSGTMYYPYWLASATGALEEKGFHVKLIDAPAENLDLEQTLSLIKKFNPGVVVVETSTPSIDNDINFIKQIKRDNEKVVACLVGTHPTAEADSILSNHPEIDLIARGEYDLILIDVAECAGRGRSFHDVQGVSYCQGGQIVHSSNRDYIRNLDELPFLSGVYKKHLNLNNYYFSIVKNPMLMLITGRGCPNNCFFCVYPQTMHGRKYRYRSAENVVEELIYIRDNIPGIREVVFEDDTFTANIERTRNISELILKKNIKMDWFANVRVDVDQETLGLMKKAGFNSCAAGFESGNQELLDKMGKGITLDQSIKFMENCKKLGIYVHGCFMVGFPGENSDSMEKTFQFAKKLECDSAQFYPVFLYPGTEAYQWAKKNAYLKNVPFVDWLDASGRHQCVFDSPDISAEEMMKFCEKAYKRYHLSPIYIAKKIKQGIMNPGEGIKTLRSGLNYLNYLFRHAA